MVGACSRQDLSRTKIPQEQEGYYKRSSGSFFWLVQRLEANMHIPPGLVFCAQRFPRLLLPPALVYVLHRLCWSFLAVNLPTWGLILSYLFSAPFVLFVNVAYSDYMDGKDAANRDVQLPPRVYDRWPLGLSLLRRVRQNFKTGYPGLSACFAVITRP